MAMDDRYGRSDFSRQDRYQDFDHRDRGRFQDNPRGVGPDRDGQVRDEPPGHLCCLYVKVTGFCFQHFSERHGRESWSGGYDKRMNPR